MSNPCATKQKLLEVAGEVFAEKGFRDATVRDICEKAGANVASVNYHFGDKEKLYAEVFKYVHEVDCLCHRDIFPEDQTAEEQLHCYISSILKKMLLPGKFSWKGTLMAREMADPSPVLNEIVEFWIRPMSDQLKAIIAKIIDKPENSDAVFFASNSVFGQIFFLKHGHTINIRLTPSLNYDEHLVDKLIHHIFTFSLAGLQIMKGNKKIT